MKSCATLSCKSFPLAPCNRSPSSRACRRSGKWGCAACCPARRRWTKSCAWSRWTNFREGPTDLDPRPRIIMKARRREVTILLVAGALAVGGFLFHLHSRQTQLQGKVILKGIPPPEIPIQLDTASARLHPRGLTTRHYRVAQDGGLANVLVYIKEGLNGQTFAPPGKDATIELRRCQFEPYVIGVRTNQTIAFRNTDPFLQNVHCIPKANGN